MKANEKGLTIYISHPFRSEGSVGRNCDFGGKKCGADLRRASSGGDRNLQKEGSHFFAALTFGAKEACVRFAECTWSGSSTRDHSRIWEITGMVAHRRGVGPHGIATEVSRKQGLIRENRLQGMPTDKLLLDWLGCWNRIANEKRTKPTNQ
jgi:hypothetical protein